MRVAFKWTKKTSKLVLFDFTPSLGLGFGSSKWIEEASKLVTFGFTQRLEARGWEKTKRGCLEQENRIVAENGNIEK